VVDEVLHQRGTILVRRQYLAPGETTPWHRDPFHRVAVVLSCDALMIEYRDGGPSKHLSPKAGQVDWDEPTHRIHRAVNVGNAPYEEVTVFFLDQPNATPQPTDD
jgi:hypothetical protein